MSESAGTKHGGNWGETGFLSDVIKVGLRASAHWGGQQTLALYVFNALCQLSLDQPDKAESGFTALEIRECVANEFDKWKSPGAIEAASRNVREQWRALEKKWPQFETGLIQTAQQMGHAAIPKLDVVEGGGAGNYTRYRLLAASFEESPVAGEISAPKLLPGEIQYIEAEVSDVPKWVGVFLGSDLTKGVRRWIYLSVVLFTIALTGLLGWLAIVLLVYGDGTWQRLINLAAVFAIVTALWYTTGPLYSVIERRIVRAPWWIQDLDGSRLLEARFPPRHRAKRVALVRFAATCTVDGCGGEVTVADGWPERFGRLVGRCQEAPRSHVFSFDHITRLGRKLGD